MLRQSEMIKVSDSYASTVEDVENGKTTENSIHFVARKNVYDTCKNQIEILQSRITQTNEDIKSLKVDIQNAYITPKQNSEQKAAANHEMNMEEVNEEDSNYDEDPNDVFADYEYDLDGHEGVDANKSLPDDELGNEEQFD